MPAAPGGIASGDPALRLAGQHIAYKAAGDTRFVEIDRSTGTQVLALDTSDVPQGTNEHGLGLDADGTLVATVVNDHNFAGPATLFWASPADPARHVVRTDVTDRDVPIAGGLVDVGLDQSMAVIDLRNRVLDTHVADFHHGDGHDFDGRRLAWWALGAVRVEDYPYTPPPGGEPDFAPPPTPLPPPPGGPLMPPKQTAPTVSPVKPTATALRHLRSLRGTAIGGTARVLQIRVSVVRRAKGRCAALRSSGSFRDQSSCATGRYLLAKGTERWSFPLRRALPYGAYTVSIAAIDTAGAVGVSTLRLRVKR